MKEFTADEMLDGDNLYEASRIEATVDPPISDMVKS